MGEVSESEAKDSAGMYDDGFIMQQQNQTIRDLRQQLGNLHGDILHINEYWNGDSNEQAMLDALNHIVGYTADIIDKNIDDLQKKMGIEVTWKEMVAEADKECQASMFASTSAVAIMWANSQIKQLTEQLESAQKSNRAIKEEAINQFVQDQTRRDNSLFASSLKERARVYLIGNRFDKRK